MSKTRAAIHQAKSLRSVAPVRKVMLIVPDLRDQSTTIAEILARADGDARLHRPPLPTEWDDEDEGIQGLSDTAIMSFWMQSDHYIERGKRPEGIGLPARELDTRLFLTAGTLPHKTPKGDVPEFSLRRIFNRTAAELFRECKTNPRDGGAAMDRLKKQGFMKMDRVTGKKSKRRFRPVFEVPFAAKVRRAPNAFLKAQIFRQEMAELKLSIAPSYFQVVRLVVPTLASGGRIAILLLVLNHLTNGGTQAVVISVPTLARICGLKPRQLRVLMAKLDSYGCIGRSTRFETSRNCQIDNEITFRADALASLMGGGTPVQSAPIRPSRLSKMHGSRMHPSRTDPCARAQTL